MALHVLQEQANLTKYLLDQTKIQSFGALLYETAHLFHACREDVEVTKCLIHRGSIIHYDGGSINGLT